MTKDFRIYFPDFVKKLLDKPLNPKKKTQLTFLDGSLLLKIRINAESNFITERRRVYTKDLLKH